MEKKKEEVTTPQLGMYVFHETIYDGRERMRIVGIRENTIELEGDYSGGTHNVTQRDWLPLTGTFRWRKVCEQHEKYGSCQLPNVHCGYPNCEPFLTHPDIKTP